MQRARINAICDIVNAHTEVYRTILKLQLREGKDWPQAVKDAREEIYERYNREEPCSDLYY